MGRADSLRCAALLCSALLCAARRGIPAVHRPVSPLLQVNQGSSARELSANPTYQIASCRVHDPYRHQLRAAIAITTDLIASPGNGGVYSDDASSIIVDIVLLGLGCQQRSGVSVEESGWLELPQTLPWRECLRFAVSVVPLEALFSLLGSSVVTSALDGQEKRYRSMQEHIRRAHPEHYISKLPATEESFQLMISTPPSERPPPPTTANLGPHGYGSERNNYYGEDSSSPNTPRNVDEYQAGSMLPAASAAAALAQLHNHKLEQDWESEGDWMSDSEARKQAMRSSIELPPLHANSFEPTSDPFSHLNPNRRRELLPSILSTSPPGRSSTLPPIQRNPGPSRPRKQSVSKRAREPQHKRQKSRGEQAHLRQISHDRKAFSAEPSSALSAAYGKRWEDLIDAATSATEDVDEDRTPSGGL
ncbi:hypothetical protein B7494_g1152 [Chlorociboria aeruginascens]|nr:hypothetical protein B7494_g1152 [Chlorociboria aeruginascens]